MVLVDATVDPVHDVPFTALNNTNRGIVNLVRGSGFTMNVFY
jgi:hypothetical protein